GRIEHDTADPNKFVAFVASNTDREHGFTYTGPRMFVHISHLLGYAQSAQIQVLSHELIHAVTRNDSGPNIPTWIEEGLAQVGGQASALFAQVPLGARPSEFPTS